MTQATIQLPRPTGFHSVGVITYFLHDMSRQYNDKQGRPLLVRIYYPAIETERDYPPYLADTMHLYKEKIVRTSGIALEDLVYLDAIKDWAMPDAPINTEHAPFPVLLFSPGFLMASQLYSALIEEMASHGYVVIAMNHTDACWPVMFPNGLSPALAPEFVNIFSNPEQSCIETFDRVQETWIQDIEFVLSWLHNQSLKKFLDFSCMGIFGHSFGGSTATEAVRRFNVFKAMANLDSMLFGAEWNAPFQTPSLFVIAEKQLTHEDALKVGLTIEQCDSLLARSSKKVFDQLSAQSFCVTIKNTDHASFVDSKLIKSPLSKSKINPLRCIEITRALLVDFFDSYLRNKQMMMLKEEHSKFPDILLQQK